jgi:hypothetical protein
MPDSRTVFRWLGKHDEFRLQYARACEARSDAHAEDIIDIADDGTNDWIEVRDKDGVPVGYRENGEALRRSALRVDARKWLMAKMRPKRYGDKLQLAGDASAPLQVVVQRIGASDGRASDAEPRGADTAALVERMGDGAECAAGLGLADASAAELPAVEVRRLADGDQ